MISFGKGPGVGLAAIVLLCACPSAQAQNIRFEGSASIWWEASFDGGATWQRELVTAPSSTRSVMVRSVCDFERGPQYYFNGIGLDGTVTGIGGAGERDVATGLRRNAVGIQPLAAQRFANVIKLDDADDREPPGLGPLRIVVVQSQALGPYPTITPYWMIQYNLSLDGSTGDRVVDAWYRVPPGFPQDRYVAIGINFSQDLIYPSVTNHPLTIRVVPSPASVFVVLSGMATFVRRRR